MTRRFLPLPYDAMRVARPEMYRALIYLFEEAHACEWRPFDTSYQTIADKGDTTINRARSLVERLEEYGLIERKATKGRFARLKIVVFCPTREATPRATPEATPQVTPRTTPTPTPEATPHYGGYATKPSDVHTVTHTGAHTVSHTTDHTETHTEGHTPIETETETKTENKRVETQKENKERAPAGTLVSSSDPDPLPIDDGPTPPLDEWHDTIRAARARYAAKPPGESRLPPIPKTFHDVIAEEAEARRKVGIPSGLAAAKARRKAAAAPKEPEPTPEPSPGPGPTPEPVSALPEWGRPGKLKLPKGTDRQALVRAVCDIVTAITGRLGPAPKTNAKPVLSLWKNLDHPEPSVFAQHMLLIAEAAKDCPHPIFAKDIRAEGWDDGTDRSRSVASLCRLAPTGGSGGATYDERLQEARQWAAEGRPKTWRATGKSAKKGGWMTTMKAEIFMDEPAPPPREGDIFEAEFDSQEVK